jgi:hypothetical protein
MARMMRVSDCRFELAVFLLIMAFVLSFVLHVILLAKTRYR